MVTVALPERTAILAVLVLYRCSLQESMTWKTLLSQMDSKLAESIQFQLLICENGALSPESARTLLPAWAEYVGVRENHGLAWAYHLALMRAKERGAAWLLTLDQDTALPPDFLRRIAAPAKESGEMRVVAGRPIGAVVPQLASEDGRVHSPVIASVRGERMVPRGYQGPGEGEVRAYNSAALVRVDALTRIGGYDRRFWLDYLDHATFHSMHRAGYGVWICGDLQLGHHLSLHDDRGRLSEQRFMNFSAAESAFRDLHASWVERILFTCGLFLRAINQRRRRDPEHFLRTTLSIVKARLFVPRAERLRRWEAEVAPMSAEPKIVLHAHGADAGGRR